MRASRLLAIMILLQSRQRITADVLAREFEVAPRTIYRDIDALSAAGVPVYGDRGPGGGFALLDGYRTRLTGLQRDEAAALALMGVPQAASSVGLGAALRQAFNKLLVALPGEGGAQAGLAAECFHVDPADWYRAGESVPALPQLARAVLDRRRIAMVYTSWTSRRDWHVEPLGLVLKGAEWYLVARSAEQFSTFRVAGIETFSVDDATFERPTPFNLAAWWAQAQAELEGKLFAVTATLRATPEGCERLGRLSPRGKAAIAAGGPVDAAGWIQLELAAEDSDHGARELLALGAGIEVLAPLSLRHRIAGLAQATAALYKGEAM